MPRRASIPLRRPPVQISDLVGVITGQSCCRSSKEDRGENLVPSSNGNQVRHVDIVLANLAVKAGTIDTKEISSGLFLAARSLQGPLNHQFSNVFERHV